MKAEYIWQYGQLAYHNPPSPSRKKWQKWPETFKAHISTFLDYNGPSIKPTHISIVGNYGIV